MKARGCLEQRHQNCGTTVLDLPILSTTLLYTFSAQYLPVGPAVVSGHDDLPQENLLRIPVHITTSIPHGPLYTSQLVHHRVSSDQLHNTRGLKGKCHEKIFQTETGGLG